MGHRCASQKQRLRGRLNAAERLSSTVVAQDLSLDLEDDCAGLQSEIRPLSIRGAGMSPCGQVKAEPEPGQSQARSGELTQSQVLHDEARASLARTAD